MVVEQRRGGEEEEEEKRGTSRRSNKQFSQSVGGVWVCVGVVAVESIGLADANFQHRKAEGKRRRPRESRADRKTARPQKACCLSMYLYCRVITQSRARSAADATSSTPCKTDTEYSILQVKKYMLRSTPATSGAML